MNKSTENKNAHLSPREPLTTHKEYKPLPEQKKSLYRKEKRIQWDKYIHWPSANDQMELNLEFKEEK